MNWFCVMYNRFIYIFVCVCIYKWHRNPSPSFTTPPTSCTHKHTYYLIHSISNPSSVNRPLWYHCTYTSLCHRKNRHSREAYIYTIFNNWVKYYNIDRDRIKRPVVYSVAREINTRLSLAIQRRGAVCLHVPMRYNRTALSLGPEIIKCQNLYCTGGVTHRNISSLFSTTFVPHILAGYFSTAVIVILLIS